MEIAKTVIYIVSIGYLANKSQNLQFPRLYIYRVNHKTFVYMLLFLLKHSRYKV